MLVWDGIGVYDTELKKRITLSHLEKGLLFTDPLVWGMNMDSAVREPSGLKYDRASIALIGYITNIVYLENSAHKAHLYDELHWGVYKGNGVVIYNGGYTTLLKVLVDTGIHDGIVYMRHLYGGTIRIEFDREVHEFMTKVRMLIC